MTPLLAAVLAYLLVQFGIGVWASRRVRSESDYLLAGRKLGYPLATFSLFATWFGAETILGSAGRAYRDGVSIANAEPFGYGLCLIGMGAIFAIPLWRRKLTTLADLFGKRYSIGVERLAAVILIPSSVLWAAAQLRAFGQVLALSSTIPLTTAITIATTFTVLYTAVGGLLADAITDMVQGIVVSLGLIAILIAVFLALPDGVSFSGLLTSPPVSDGPASASSWLEIAEAWSIPVIGSLLATELVSRVIATPTEQIARRSALMAGGIYITVGLIPLIIGIAGRALLPTLSDAETVVPTVALQVLNPAMFVVFAGAVLSAILSTVDSTLLVASGLLSHNLAVPLFGVKDERLKVRLARAGVVGFGLIAWGLAVRAEGVFALVEQASALGSAGAVVVVVFALFTNLGGRWTATATLLLGLASYLAGVIAGVRAPFLLSLGTAVAVYLTGVLAEAALGVRTSARATGDLQSGA